MRIPPAIDSSMWEVVESGDQVLMDEFAARYPELKGELAKRLTMVRDLKGSRPRTDAKPVFQPRNDVQMPRPPLQWTSSTVALAVVGTVLITFGMVKVIDQFQARQAPIVVEQPPKVTPSYELYEPPTVTNLKPNQAGDPVNPDPGQAPPRIDPVQLDPFQKTVTIATEDSSLSDVLQDIATQANLVLEAAPGMPNERIHARYVNVPAMKVLEELGRTCGFTALKQSRRSALLIPARDGRSTTGGLPSTGSTDPSSSTGGSPLRGPVNPRDTPDPVLPPVGE